MLYFAYGSNMDWNQMRDRCPSACFVGVALLPDHRLAFTRKSERRECGVADAVADKDSKVWGVVYQIDEKDIGKLDAYEDYRLDRQKNAYQRESRHVFGDGKKKNPFEVAVYFANRQDKPPLPNQAYKDLILAGAKHWHLPDEYIENVLEPIKVE